MSDNNTNIIAYRKKSCPKGTRIVLVKMGNDPNPIRPGTKGTVGCVDDIGTVHVHWDDGRCLGLVVGEDQFRLLTQSEKDYAKGEWDMFVALTAVIYGKQCYYKEDDGTIFSRISGKHHYTVSAAVGEFTAWVQNV